MPRYDGNIEQGPATNAVAITPNDSADLPNGQCRSIYVGVSGNITLDTPNQTNVLFPNVPVGVLSVAAVRVRATGTAASGLLALW
jgi:hypothetical protein